MDKILLDKLCGRCREKAFKLPDSEEKERVFKMLETLLENNDWADLKIGKWLGFIEGFLIFNNITTVDNERNFTRKIYHEHYKKNNIKIPKTTDVMKLKK